MYGKDEVDYMCLSEKQIDEYISLKHPKVKAYTDRKFIMHLFEEGRKTADKWIEKNYDFIGKKSTADVAEEFVD